LNPDPVTDIVAFLTKPVWYTAAFWLLLNSAVGRMWRDGCFDW
jgi:hypothetical protein